MKNKLFSIFIALLISVLITSTAGAGGFVKLNNVEFSLGSLIAKGYASGLGKTDVTVKLDASGDAAVICTNNGNNDVPGQSSPKVAASDYQHLLGNDPLRKNGRSPFFVEAGEQETVAWDVAGCPGPNWTAHIDFVWWTNATISVYDTASGNLLKQQNYACVTTRETASVICTLTN